MRVHVGTSGWQYSSWRERFYPKGVAQTRWLSYYAARFACVEVNNTFYNLPSEETFRKWRDAVPEDFAFVLKASRYLTHVRRLRDPEDPVKLFLERSRPLRRRTPVILLQLPPRFKADPPRLDRTLRAFPRSQRIAVEFRDESWYVDPIREVLTTHNAALCRADRGGACAEPGWRTADWIYLRFHEGDGRPHPCYRPQTLSASARALAEQSRGMTDAYVFFNNDERCCAVRDAAAFATACRESGLSVTRAEEQRDQNAVGDGSRRTKRAPGPR
ncbi:MAG: DUF72 domain-containing protein [Candidatus Dormibacteraeota bacterium]|nr:DUF72 domain-containing protein [Candidatus Dormibacteraeota bacterium]